MAQMATILPGENASMIAEHLNSRQHDQPNQNVPIASRRMNRVFARALASIQYFLSASFISSWLWPFNMLGRYAERYGCPESKRPAVNCCPKSRLIFPLPTSRKSDEKWGTPAWVDL